MATLVIIEPKVKMGIFGGIGGNKQLRYRYWNPCCGADAFFLSNNEFGLSLIFIISRRFLLIDSSLRLKLVSFCNFAPFCLACSSKK
jgi:hypothetical protein